MGFTGKQQSLPAHPPNLQNYNMSIYCVDLDDDDTNAKHWPCRKHLGNIMLTAKSRQSLVAPKEFPSSNLSLLKTNDYSYFLLYLFSYLILLKEFIVRRKDMIQKNCSFCLFI